MKSARAQLKWTFILLTILVIFLEFYSLLYKLPFDVSMSNKKLGFFNLYLYNLTQNFSLWIPLIQFVLAQVFLQTLLVLCIYFCAVQCSSFDNLSRHIFPIGVFLWICTQLAILFWNAYLFPYSYYSLWMDANLSSFTHRFILYLSTFVCLFALLLAFIRVFITRPKLFSFVIAGILLIFLVTYFMRQQIFPQVNSTQNPNVILILTDSLRPDYVNLKIDHQYLLPHLHELLKESIFFPNAFTTLGRSTPGLVTMITGKYPKNTGARFNLIENERLQLKQSLSTILRSQGYQTFLFADSLQFINVSPEFGFDKIFSSKHGIYDFIFTFINDLPLSNLLMNTSVGKWLFPYNYANRVSYYTYTPDVFVTFFKENLQFLQIDKPAFLVIDLTLPHWPYVWARQKTKPALPYRYLDALKALDKQLSLLMPIMQQKGLLDKSILIIASDHGDSFGVPGDRYIQEKNYRGDKNRLSYVTKYPYSIAPATSPKQFIGLDTSTGHGTDLLSSAQLNTTLAFRFYGIPFQAKTVSARVALIDIAPTVLDLLQFPPISHSDGLSLKPFMFNQTVPDGFVSRPIFIESEIEIPTIDVTQKNQSRTVINHLIDQYADLFYVDLDTQNLVLRNDAVRRLLKEKQRGILKENWLLVHFPGNNNTQSIIVGDSKEELQQCYYTYQINDAEKDGKKYICYLATPTNPYYVLINLKTYEWEVLFDQDAKQNPIFNSLLQELKGFYGEELASNSSENSHP